MYDRLPANMRNVFIWMERLDRWGYICVGLSLLAIGMFLFLSAWLSFARHVREDSVFVSSLALVNTLLLIVILLELFRTIVRFLETDVLRIEPYLAVGIIACIRGMLTASAELGDLRGVPTDFFEKYLKDMSLNAGLVIVLVVGIFILRSRPVQSGEHELPEGTQGTLVVQHAGHFTTARGLVARFTVRGLGGPIRRSP